MRKQNRKLAGKQPQAYAFAPVIARGGNRLAVNNSGEVAVIDLIGSIGKSYWDDSGITEKEFRAALKSIPAGKPVTLNVNSEGGSVQEGLGIYNAIKDRAADVTCRITGYAVSIASVFPLAAGKVVSPKSAIWMIHCAWSWAQGNAEEMRQAAEMLDKHDQTLLDIYAENTGKTPAELKADMEKETWLTGNEAVAYGLADEGDDADEDDAASAGLRPLNPAILARCKNLSAPILAAVKRDTQPTPAAAAPAAPTNPPASTAASTSAAPQTAGNEPNQPQPQDHTMNKDKIVALLLTHGIKDAAGKDLTVTSTDAEFEAALNALAKKTGTDAQAKMEAIEAKLAIAEKRRVTDKVSTYVDAGKITKAEVLIFVSAMLNDEAGTVAILDAKEVAALGSEPAGALIQVMDGPTVSKNGVQGSKVLPELDNIFAAHKTPEARYGAMKAEFPRLLQAAFRKDNGVQAANTFSGTVTTNFLIQGVVLKTHNRFAAANLFTRDNSQDPFKPLAAGIMKFNSTTTDGSKVQTNATNFETLGGAGGGDSTIDAITITPAQYTSGGKISNAELNSGFRVADIIEAKIIDLAAKLTQVFTAPITVANFVTNAALVSAPAAFGFSDLATLQGQLKKVTMKNLLLDGEYQARIANTPGFFQMAGLTGGPSGAWQAFGWDNIALNTDWSGAGANVRGFACGKNAIGIISGLPLNPPEGIPGNIVQTGVAQLPDVNLGIATYAWFSPTSRTFYFTFDSIAGATLLDETAGVLIKSA